jgi:signal transduction histidine kinase/CheY-like chemotaxis protein
VLDGERIRDRQDSRPFRKTVSMKVSSPHRFMGLPCARYIMAVLTVSAAFAIRYFLVPYTGTGAPYVLFFASIVVTSLNAGLGPGLLATAIAAPLGAYLFVMDTGYSAGKATSIAALFIMEGVFVSYISHLFARARTAADESARALRRSEAELREAARKKDDFLAALSHELRNPLAAIRSSVDVLRQFALDAHTEQRARDIVDRQTTQLTRLVDDLLDVTRIARDKLQLRPERINLRSLVRLSIEDERSVFERRQIALHERLPYARVWVDGDKVRLVQVIHNLLNNAAKFTPPGGRVEVSLETDDREAILRVKDSGIGITPDGLARVFDPFVQLGLMETPEPGLGLGLALVRRVVELHGGTVHATSAGANAGSEFVVRLPLPLAGGAPAVGPAAQSVATLSRRVLVIDDRRDVADALQRVLHSMHHDARVAYEGASGIEMVRDFRPDVVFCDLALPGLDGYEIARQIRADAQLRSTVLVALTGGTQPEDRARAVEAGFEKHLAKPVTVEELQTVLETAGS